MTKITASVADANLPRLSFPMSRAESMDRLGTVAFAADFMRETMARNGNTLECGVWFLFVPDAYRGDALHAVDAVFPEFDGRRFDEALVWTFADAMSGWARAHVRRAP